MDAAQYGVAGVALALVGFLARILWEQQVKMRRPALNGDDAPARRGDLSELKGVHEDVKAVRVVVEALRDLTQAMVTKLAVLEYRVTELERRSHMERGSE